MRQREAAHAGRFAQWVKSPETAVGSVWGAVLQDGDTELGTSPAPSSRPRHYNAAVPPRTPDHDARRWNLSPERLYIDCWTRAFLRDHLAPAPLARVCNVGIGVGEWDDWLGYWLVGDTELTSVDIDGRIVHELRDRQAREQHPRPARAVHADLLRADLGQFDLVCVVGSTIHETHAPARALEAARRWVRPGGWLYATVLHGMGAPDRLLTVVPGIEHRRAFVDLPDAEFTAILARA